MKKLSKLRRRSQTAPPLPEQLPLKPAKRGRFRARRPRKYRWFRLYFYRDGKSRPFHCKHGSAHFAIGKAIEQFGAVPVTCTYGYQHWVPEGFTLKPIETEE